MNVSHNRCTLQKRLLIFPSSAGMPSCHLPNSPWKGITKILSASESLVGDIPSGGGKTANLFYSVYSLKAQQNLTEVLNTFRRVIKCVGGRFTQFLHVTKWSSKISAIITRYDTIFHSNYMLLVHFCIRHVW